jgi:MATE family multidrug resistance protein
LFRKHLTEVTALAWPAILQGLVVTAVFFTDRLLLGWYASDALGSMQIAGPVLWSTFSVFGAFGAGVMAVIGRAVGAGDQARARETVISVIAFAAVVGCAVGLLGEVSRGVLADLLAGDVGESEVIRGLAMQYMGIVFLGTPFAFLSLAGTVSLQADGDTRTPMWLSAAQGVVNLALSYVLIFGHFGAPELGIVGAAIGSVCSFAIGAIGAMWVLQRRKGAVSLRPLRRPRMAPLVPVLRVSIPAFGERAIFHTAFLVFAAYVGRLGELAMTANQALIAIESIGFMVTHGIGIAAAAIVAQKLGAQRPEDAETVGWMSAGLGITVMGVVSIAFFTMPEALIGLISDEPSVVAVAAPCLQVAAVALPLMAVTDAMGGALRGAGDTRTPMLVALVGPVFIRLFSCWYLAFEQGWGLYGIWIGTTLDWGTRAVLLSLVFRRGRWKRITV